MITLSKSRIASACLALAAWVPLQSHAGLLDDDEARKAILELRAKVDTIARELNARIDTKSDRSSALDMVNQQEQTLSEIAKLRGQVEVLTNELANAQKRQKDFYSDLDERLRKLEPRQVTIDGREAAVDPNEQRTYDAAMAMFKGGDYKSAASALGEFVRRYPASGYAANAQYWLGNAYYALRDYKNAISAQETVVSQYRDSAKAPDAMLNIASSYTELKDTKNARKALKDLVAKYPESSAAQAAKDRLAVLK
ncbi:tol-pal system protein YbgF [Massilia violaceinigra]|uniref:Cell division coordinator CpoB n=1 Tax=Massilia violaceinigra TaxID=2045208 RepID=A0ABY4A0U2_9BURK|nr:tol-pal system protein YbgF [Massilia violaceinigra]UOD27982.1 tol-pal system protein YbgF [Massilia violaceinigra]